MRFEDVYQGEFEEDWEPIDRGDGVLRYKLEKALQVASYVERELQPACRRVMLVGSCRRKRATVKDLEFLVEPKMQKPENTLFEDFTDPVSALPDLMQKWFKRGWANPRLKADGTVSAWGPWTFRLVWGENGFPVDIFSVKPGQSWGVKELIYTGPAEFSKRFVTPRAARGVLPDGYKIQDGNVWDMATGRIIEIPDEKAWFDLCGMPYMPPEIRQ